MILHISYDQLYIDNVIKLFEEASPDTNYYLVLTSKDLTLKNIKSKHPNVLAYNRNHFNISIFLKNNPNIRSVIVHSLSPGKASLLLSASKYVKTLWMFWGADFYQPKVYLNHKLYGDKTQKFLRINRYKSLYIFLQSKILNSLFYLRHSFNTPGQLIKKAIISTDYCAPVFLEDYLLLKEIFPQTNAKYLAFNYGTIEQFTGSLKDKKISKNNILVGNSASAENNHLEIFEILKNIKISNQLIIVPLSYGNQNYKKKIISIGSEYFKDNFNPLKNFLPLDEYISILSSCGIVIMNHYRQQALGNIIASLWLGAKVYINDNITTWRYFKRLGIHVFSIDKELTLDNPNLFSPLSDQQIYENRQALMNEFSPNNVLARTKNIIDTLEP